ncbi:MAG TPA: hypothetical protein VNO86_12365 [Candidatus Binatia bacterium]|nr:hypothetical protein [Candidatus Binatia bacterium]
MSDHATRTPPTRLVHPAELRAELEARASARPQVRRMKRLLRRRVSLLWAAVTAGLLVGALVLPVAGSGSPIDLTSAGAPATVNGAVVQQSNFSGSTGTGVFESFVRFQANGTEQGYNTSGRPLEFDENSSSQFTRDLPLNAVPMVTVGGVAYREFRLDINETAGQPSSLLSIDRIRMFLSPTPGIKNADPDSPTFGQSDGTFLVWDLDGAGDVYLKVLYDLAPGSGNGDVRLLVPNDSFGTAGQTCQYNPLVSCGQYVYLYTKAGEEFSSDDGFEEWSVRKAPFVTVTKTAQTTFTRTFHWTIDKTVSPASWDLFTGDSGTSEYTVSVEKTGFTDSDWAVSGTISIANPSGSTVVISSVSDVVSEGISATVDCGVTFPYSLANGATLNCTYSASLPDGSNRTNTATVTLADGSAFTATASVTFGEPTTVVDGTVHVSDTNGGSWSFSDSGSVSYTQTFSCDEDEGTHENTATITETDQSASASVEVNCYGLEVSKTAETTFTRTYEWTIEKSSNDPNGQNLLLNVGETYVDYPYSITVDATFTDSDWAVSGSISVHNPAPVAATLTGVADAISGVGAASVDCGVTFPYSLAAGATLDCTYSASLPDGSDRTNTATATLQNHSYDSNGTATESGTTDFSASADVDFESATMTEVDETITVSDTFAGELGTVTFGVDTLPKTFTYTRTFGPFPADECGEHDFPNTASFTTNDTEATGESSWNVHVSVPCLEGCTLTQGYWKTHSVYGPAKPSDPTWDLLPGGQGADTPFFTSGKSWYEVFWTAPKGGNAYYILAHQYMAAKLNILAGASTTSEVDTAIAWAETFFSTYGPTSTLSKAVRQQAIATAGTLGQYNEGLIGPGHCSEDRIARTASG